MSGIADDFKKEWFRPDNILPRIIIINVVVFVVLNLIQLFCTIFNVSEVFYAVTRIFYLPAEIISFLITPWTIITYAFAHTAFFHLLSNMLFLYWFGAIAREYLGNQRILALYIFGAVAGAVPYLIMYNTIDYFIVLRPALGMLGASASVYAIIVAAATLLPNYKVHLFLIGEVKLKYIAMAVVFLSFIAVMGSNAGGDAAHLGGALLGFVFAKEYQKGRDWSKPFIKFLNWTENIFKRKPVMRVMRNENHQGQKNNSEDYQMMNPNEEIIDKILDKISESGYESLSKEEKQVLFRASQKK